MSRKIKAKKIVSIKFDDGTEMKFRSVFDLNCYIEAYIEAQPLKEYLRALAAATSIDWPVQARLAEQRQAIKLEKRAIASKSGSVLRRTDVTKERLGEYREAYYAKEGKYRGWKKAAQIDMKIDNKTINKRMKE